MKSVLATATVAVLVALGCMGSDPVSPPAPASPAAPATAAPATPVAAPVAAPADASVYSGRLAGEHRLTPKEVAALGDADLRILRNEVFARHGRAFQSADLQEHFGSQPWYTPDPDYTDDRLTEADHANVALIATFETDRDPVRVGEFHGAADLFFVDENWVRVGSGGGMYEDAMYEGGGGMYEDAMYEGGASDLWHYIDRGDWVLVYQGDAVLLGDLYHLDYDAAEVTERYDMP